MAPGVRGVDRRGPGRVPGLISVTETSPGLGARAVDRVLGRLRKLPSPRNGYVIERGLRTPTRDGFALVSDHYAPAAADRETADALGISVAAAKARLFHARSALRKSRRLRSMNRR